MSNKRWRFINYLAIILLFVSFVSFSQNKLITNYYIELKEMVTRPKRAYLTFDDGPSVQTDKVLDILKEKDVKATFFVVGKDDDKSIERYQRIVSEGHTLGLHSYSHNYKEIYESLESFAVDLMKLSDFLFDVTGERPTVYRFPGGSSTSAIPKWNRDDFIDFLNDQNLIYYDWNALSGDAVNHHTSAWQLNQNILKDVADQESCIILMHDSADMGQTVEALGDLIDELKEMDYDILPISESTKVIQHVKSNKGIDKQ